MVTVTIFRNPTGDGMGGRGVGDLRKDMSGGLEAKFVVVIRIR